jgi:hypothetical protein
VIYFVLLPNKAVKIGWTDNLRSRLSVMPSRYKGPVELLKTVPGDPDQESEIHQQFSHLRLGLHEQFRPAADLMNFIGRPDLVVPDTEVVEPIERPRPSLGRKDVTTKIDGAIHRKAKIIAGNRNVSLAEYLSELLRGPVDRDYMRELKRAGEEETTS